VSADPTHAYRTTIPTPAYALSKAGVNCYTQALASLYPTLRVNACSPGLTNTGMCAAYSGPRTPKAPVLGASVFAKVPPPSTPPPSTQPSRWKC